MQRSQATKLVLRLPAGRTGGREERCVRRGGEGEEKSDERDTGGRPGGLAQSGLSLGEDEAA